MPNCPICNRELGEKELQVHIKYYHVDVCPECSSQVVYQEGCKMCPSCGWSKCV